MIRKIVTSLADVDDRRRLDDDRHGPPLGMRRRLRGPLYFLDQYDDDRRPPCPRRSLAWGIAVARHRRRLRLRRRCPTRSSAAGARRSW
ncbi:MAG: hypothetical protein MZV70_00290 [Desulfobacterales bacterium]|nr:hypothetical protein [Desulfobacterales bacterium]